MENERNSRRFESVFSHKVRAGKRRTYFFDVRKTKGEDYYITLTESTKRFNGDGYERHKIFLYKEDFNRFMDGLKEAVDHIKTELMPDYDYDEYTRRNQEWEERRAQMNEEENASLSSESDKPDTESTEPDAKSEKPNVESEEDMEW